MLNIAKNLHERYNHRGTLNDIDECNEWLVGELDVLMVLAFGNYLVFNEDSLDWIAVYKTLGAEEPLACTRPKKKKRVGMICFVREGLDDNFDR